MAIRAIVCLAVGICSASSGIAQTQTLAPSDNSGNRKIERLVAQEHDIVFNNATLADVAAYLESQGIPTFLDRRALDDVAITTDTPVSFRRGSIRLSDGLYLLLRPLDLTWTIRHGRLIITTPEEEESLLITRIYDVRNLVELVPVQYWDGGYDAKTAYQYDFDSLLELITATVAPETWDEVGGPGSMEPFWTRRMRVVVVSQTYEIHQRIETLLHKLAKYGGAHPLPSSPAFSLPTSTNTLGSRPIFPQSQGTSRLRSSRLRSTGGIF